MQPELTQPESEIDDEDTIDESLQEKNTEDKRDTVIESLLVRKIKKHQSETKMKAVSTTGPTSEKLWIKNPEKPKKQ